MKRKISNLTSILVIITFAPQQLVWGCPGSTYEVHNGLRPRAAGEREGPNIETPLREAGELGVTAAREAGARVFQHEDTISSGSAGMPNRRGEAEAIIEAAFRYRITPSRREVGELAQILERAAASGNALFVEIKSAGRKPPVTIKFMKDEKKGCYTFAIIDEITGGAADENDEQTELIIREPYVELLQDADEIFNRAVHQKFRFDLVEGDFAYYLEQDAHELTEDKVIDSVERKAINAGYRPRCCVGFKLKAIQGDNPYRLYTILSRSKSSAIALKGRKDGKGVLILGSVDLTPEDAEERIVGAILDRGITNLKGMFISDLPGISKYIEPINARHNLSLKTIHVPEDENHIRSIVVTQDGIAYLCRESIPEHETGRTITLEAYLWDEFTHDFDADAERNLLESPLESEDLPKKPVAIPPGIVKDLPIQFLIDKILPVATMYFLKRGFLAEIAELRPLTYGAHEVIQDANYEEAYEAHVKEPQKGIVRRADSEIVKDAIGAFREIEEKGSVAAKKIADKLEALRDNPPEGCLVIDGMPSGINIVNYPGVKLSHAGGYGINLIHPDPYELLHEAMAGCMKGRRERIHELADEVVRFIKRKDYEGAKEALETADPGIARNNLRAAYGALINADIILKGTLRRNLPIIYLSKKLLIRLENRAGLILQGGVQTEEAARIMAREGHVEDIKGLIKEISNVIPADRRFDENLKKLIGDDGLMHEARDRLQDFLSIATLSLAEKALWEVPAEERPKERDWWSAGENSANSDVGPIHASPAKKQTGKEIHSGVVRDLLSILELEGVPYLLDVELGNPLFFFFFHDHEYQQRYLRNLREGREFTERYRATYLAKARKIPGVVLRRKNIEALAEELGVSTQELWDRLNLPKEATLVVAIQKNTPEFVPALLEETFHVLAAGSEEWASASLRKGAIPVSSKALAAILEREIDEAVNDLLILVVLSKKSLRSFRFSSVPWTEEEKIALHRHYREEWRLNPNFEMTRVIEALRTDLARGTRLIVSSGPQSETSVSIAQLILKRLLQVYPEGFEEYEAALREYVGWLARHERFRFHQALFPLSYVSSARPYEKRIGSERIGSVSQGATSQIEGSI